MIRYQYSCYPHYLHTWCGWWHKQLPIVKWKITLKTNKMLTKEQVSEKVINEIQDGMESIGDINRPQVVDVDMENETITLKFSWRQIKEDNYVGLINY